MAYLVLALGAFLSIGGALSIFYGAGIVEVERGWTGVIAGATSLTGGIVTIVLGLILKALLDLRPILASRALVAAVEPTHVTAANHPLPPSPQPDIVQAGVETPEFDSGLLAAFLAPKEIEAEPAHGHAEPHPPRLQDGSETPDPLFEDEPIHHASDTPEEALLPEAVMASPEPAAARSKVSFRRPSLPPLPPEPEAAEPQAAPAMDDWLDRAFISLDNEAHPASHEAPSFVADPPPVHAELAHAEPELAAVAAPAPQYEAEPYQPEPEAAPPPTAAVIGRYEADGTSYVMFADGSIEAQSDAGVYRFNSMTELKAFIEGSG